MNDDGIVNALVEYADSLSFEQLAAEVRHAAKLHAIDTLGALIAGFDAEPCRVARMVASEIQHRAGATMVGTVSKTSPDIAAYVNATTARYAEIAGRYDLPGSIGAHTSDTIMPLLAAAEHVHTNGRELITAIVLAYAVCSHLSHMFKSPGFDNTNLSCLAAAIAAGKLLGLRGERLAHCISIAIVPNAILKQVKRGHKTMYKAVASGDAARAAVFAALVARAGMEGPHKPFEGSAGWCDYVAGTRFALTDLERISPLILETRIKIRPAAGPAIASMLAAEKVAPLKVAQIEHITVEVNRMAKERCATDTNVWKLASREDADHSVPYLVAASLKHGAVTLRRFDDEHIRDPDLQRLMDNITVNENEEFTRAYERTPQQQRARVTVVTTGGERRVGESGGDSDDLSAPKSDAQVEKKFRALTEEHLGVHRVSSILQRLWQLETISDVADIPPLFVIGGK